MISENSVQLNWSIASELNNRGFEIERKNLEWEKIGFVQGRGTTTELCNYTYFDENLSTGKYHYRLKQVDFDGTFVYSKTIEVEIGIPNKFSLSQNYPNPFNPSTKISWQSPVSGWHTLKVYDILGNEVAKLVDEYKPAGKYEIEFYPASSIKNLASGIYFYRLKAGDFVQTKKMILIK